MSAAIDFSYAYAFPSGMDASPQGRPRLSLATCNADHTQPYFFEGRVRQPRLMGEMLYVLSDVVRTHFFLPQPALLDPVLTSNEHLLRLEGFSGCGGVYARVDLPASVFEGERHGRGTTNVDFNTPMRNALLRLRDHEDVQFAVGADEVVLSKSDSRTVEKKVRLPLRWLKGFSEAQAYQTRLALKMEVSAAEALIFLRSLPKAAKPKMPSYAISTARSIRLSQRPQRGAVPLLGTHRIKVIEPLLVRAKSLRVWADDTSGASGWEVCFTEGSFFLMISPEVFRGFSGEGQVLSALAKPPSDLIIARVRASLKWQSQLDATLLARELGLGKADVADALAVLGSRGLAGFDAAAGHYFHRELPFDLETVEDMQPRLLNARKLVADGRVACLEGGSGLFAVEGTGTTHRVRLSGAHTLCTCPWFSRYASRHCTPLWSAMPCRNGCPHSITARPMASQS